MATTISQRELRNDNADIMRRVERGERFTVTRRGKPIASVIPHEEVPLESRRLTVGEIQELWRTLPPIDTKGWWADILEARRAYDDGMSEGADEDAWAREARKNREREEWDVGAGGTQEPGARGMGRRRVMQVLLDTSVVIDATELDLSDWEQSGPMISAVTLAELYSGVEVGDAIERAGRRGRVNLARSSYRILPFGEDEAEAYGLLSTLLRELGRQRRRRALDLQIAATAMVYRVPLLTRNARDLVGLERVVKVVAV